MKAFEFVLIVVSLIVGLALTEFATGVADMIRTLHRAHFYWAHIILIAYGFISCLTYWTTIHKLRRVNRWSVFHIAIVLMSGLLFFISTRIVFPDRDTFDLDYEKYFNDQVSTIFIMVILYIIFYMLESFVIKGVRKWRSYGMRGFSIMLLLSGVVIQHETYRAGLVLVLFLLQLYFIYSMRIVVEDEV